MRKHNKRRRYPVVIKSLQYKFLAMVLIYSLITVVFLAIFLLVPDIIQVQNEKLSPDLRADAAYRIRIIHSRVWTAVVGIICILGLHSFHAFHRILGPLYRFRRAFQQMRNGALNFRINIRKKDYLHTEEKELNKMIAVLAGKIESIQLAGQSALVSFSELELWFNELNRWKEIDKERLHAVRRHIETLVETTRYFQLHKVEQAHSLPGGQEKVINNDMGHKVSKASEKRHDEGIGPEIRGQSNYVENES